MMVTRKKNYETVPDKPLIGLALLQQLDNIGECEPEEKARLCGYYYTSKNGARRADVTSFLYAFIDAEGLSPRIKGAHTKVLRVTKNHVLVIPSRYLYDLGCAPGDLFEIEVDPQTQEIHLLGVEAD